MTLFDPDPFNPKPLPADTDTVPLDDGLACRAVGCSAPFDQHLVSQAAVENATHRRPNPPPKKRKRT